jgi:hypothetical protein
VLSLTPARLKDCDVTWLYGPLRTRSDRSLRIRSCSPASSTLIPKSNFLLKKPILKKRNTSEIMLQRSVLASPGTGEEKHIHFNEQVEQCISLEMKGGKDEEPDSYAIQDYDSSDSNDGAIMMKRTNSKWGLPLISSRQGKPRANSSADSKTIAVLPSTTLKRGGKALPPLEIAVKHNNEQPLSVVTGCKETIVVTREGLQNLHTPKSSSSINSCLSSMPTKKTKTSWPRKVHFGK